MPAISKTQRWLDLIAFLLGRHFPVPVDEIIEHMPAYAAGRGDADETRRASTRRMFERDKAELIDLGIPLKSVIYDIDGGEKMTGYVIRKRDFYLPYLRLIESEAEQSSGPRPAGAPSRIAEAMIDPADARLAFDALRRVADAPAFPFAAEARSAYRKLSFDLDPERFAAAPVLWVEPPGTADLLDRLRTLSDALLARKRVRFTYHGVHRGQSTERAVHPYGLFFQRDWYLVAHDPERDALRVFRVGRMEDAEANGKAPQTHDYEIPDDFRLEAFLDREAWELGEAEDEPLQADVRFRFPACVWVARNAQGELIEECADGSAVRRFEVRQTDPFLRWLLSFGGDATVTHPPELASGLERMAATVGAMYADGGDGKG